MKLCKVLLILSVMLVISVLVASANPVKINVAEYGARGDGISDDTNALRTALGSAAGRTISLQRNAKYFITGELNVLDGTTIQGNGALLIFSPAANDNALSVKSSNVTVKDLRIRPYRVTAGPHGTTRTPIVIGECGKTYGNKPYKNIAIDNVTIQGGYDRMNGIVIAGDVSGVRISNVHIKGSSMYGYATNGILVHWSANNTNKPDTTYHPHDISIKNVFCENVSVGAAHEQPSCIFLSGAYSVDITNVRGTNINTGVYVYPGDFGFDFARASDGKEVRDIRISDVKLKKVRNCGFRLLGQASGKGPSLYMGVSVEGAVIRGAGGGSFSATKVDKVLGGVKMKNVK